MDLGILEKLSLTAFFEREKRPCESNLAWSFFCLCCPILFVYIVEHQIYGGQAVDFQSF